MSVYPFIEAEKVEDRNVTKACELMEVSRSAFYDWVQHQPSRREVSDAELGERIEKDSPTPEATPNHTDSRKSAGHDSTQRPRHRTRRWCFRTWEKPD